MKFLLLVVFLALSFSCDNPEVPNDGCLQGKLLTVWCIEDNHGVVQILSDYNIGEEWPFFNPKYNNTVFVQLEGLKWDSVIASADSVFNFTYRFGSEKPQTSCRICCAPEKGIYITSILSNPCTPGSEGTLPTDW